MPIRIQDRKKPLPLRAMRIRAGILEDPRGGERRSTDEHSGGLTILEIAEIHEFGTDTVPQRSFVRGYLDENPDQVSGFVEAAIRRTLRSNNIQLEMDRAALQVRDGIVARIVAHIEPELAPATIARKGSSTPLIDHGILKSAIAAVAEPNE